MSNEPRPSPVPSRVLIIKAKGGLGNRMLSAVTGIVLAQLNNRAPMIDWRDGMYVEAGRNLYPLLFDAQWMGDLSAFDQATDVAPAIWSGRITEHPVDIIRRNFPKQHQDPLLYRRISIDLIRPDPPEQVGVFWSYLPKLLRLKKRISSNWPTSTLDELASDMLAQYLVPVKEVTASVDAIFALLPAQVIGVHIRFTDRKAPLPKIVRQLEKLKRRNPRAGIFLATDSAEAQEALLTRFPDAKVIDKALALSGQGLHFASDGFSDPVAEARNALIDMVALSRCHWLIHSSHSTFSVTAALMGRIARQRQFDVDRTNLRVRLKQLIQARL